MKSTKNNQYKESRRINSWVYVAFLCVNVFVFVCIGMVYAAYTKNYSQKLFDENINNVNNLNSAAANAAYTYVNSMCVKIEDIVSYVESRELGAAETIRYLRDSNTDPARQFQLILCGSYDHNGKLRFSKFSGVSVRKAKKADGSMETVENKITYGGGYYDIRRSLSDVGNFKLHKSGFAHEFTDPDTKRKSFAVSHHMILKDADTGQSQLYAILLVVNSNKALAAFNMQDKYKGQSTVLINENGDYIIKNNDYRNVNFYDYIVNYNGLATERRAEILKEVTEKTHSGNPTTNIFYRNHQGRDCVFSIVAMNNSWYSVTCVPLSSFDLEDDSVNYSLYILLLFLMLFAFDGVVIYLVGKTMNYNIAVAERATAAANEASSAKSRFLSTMSHELRTPLNAIIGFATLSSDSVDDTPVLRDYLRKINISSKLLLQLISDILDVSAIESGKMKINETEFNIARLITSLSSIYYDQCANKGVEFNVSLRNIHSETLIGDPVRVNQVLLNFLSNAVKFTPSGGTVTLGVETVRREGRRVVIRFTITDTGCGISDELMSRLFMPFERATGDAASKYSGTGLGLSISSNLAKLMKGQVGVESHEGTGSSFWVELPFTAPAERTSNSFSQIRGLRVAAAVNNAGEREYIGQILSNIGAAHIMVDSAEAALALLREEKDGDSPFNLCMLDWKMSDLNAVDTTKKIRTEFDAGALHVMVLAYDIAEARPMCVNAGADLVFAKPVFSSTLYNVLEEITTNVVRKVPPEIGAQYNLKGKRVLLVEDNKMNVEVARLILRKFGLEVETACNGQVGYESFTASKAGYFDAVLMDVQMPVMNGYQATMAIRTSAHPDARTVPILAMTADAFSEDVEKARAAGMDEHISKPIEPSGLYQILKKYLG